MRVSSTGKKPVEPKYKQDGDFIQQHIKSNAGQNNVRHERPVENVEKSVDNSAKMKVNNTKNVPVKKKNPVVKESDSTPSTTPLGKIGVGKKVLMVLIACIVSVCLFGVVRKVYNSQITYPDMMEVDETTTGSYCLRQWQDSINSMSDAMGTLVDSEAHYLYDEIKYANEDEDRLDFLRKVLGTIEYRVEQVEAKNKYGNTMKDESGNVVYKDSDLSEGESVELYYVDYDAIEVNKEDVQVLLQEEEISSSSVNYSSDLIGVFCKYISSMEKLPITSDKRYIPSIEKKGNSYTINKEEDINLDKLLFSSDSFRDLMLRFSVAAGATGEENPEWTEWNKLSKKKKKKVPEPVKVIEELQPTAEWLKWNNLTDEQKGSATEPEKYDKKKLIDMNWCGAYYLQVEHTDEEGNTSPISAMLGDGSFKNPASIDTDVITNVLTTDEKGKEKVVPIRIRMVEYGVSEEAIDWFESKDERNRGIDVNSEVQYIYYCFKITNLGEEEITVRDNISLSDSHANMSPRTGEMYGLKDMLVLKPDESDVLETWGMSTELNKKYVVWGKNFNRKFEPVWFRVLMGNLEDDSESKGVSLNTIKEEKE